jgi:predicted XRE-type DNA-binding protein
MSINYQKKAAITDMASLFFALGLALKLHKISGDEIKKHIALAKLNTLIQNIENERELFTWDDSPITPGERLNAALEQHELSQKDLAELLQVSNQKINDLVRGRINLTVSWAKKIGGALNVDYRVFL